MPRGARLDVPGTLHHVINRGIEKREIFYDDKDRENFLTRMGDIVSDTDTEIYAWALMDNHIHILLRSGPYGLPMFMRRLMTGYAISFNLRHRRHGHLFQNRYKSIVCQEDAYFKELVRYIHLNPVRAKQVENLKALDRYNWCGHSAIMGEMKNSWQNTEYVLKFFGSEKRQAIRMYRIFVEKGMAQGDRPDLVGGGLVRSMGGWSMVKALRRSGTFEQGDERILGDGDFVKGLLAEADEIRKAQFGKVSNERKIIKSVGQCCRNEGIEIQELISGSKRQSVVKCRHKIVKILSYEYGLSMADIARRTGVSTSAVSKILST